MLWMEKVKVGHYNSDYTRVYYLALEAIKTKKRVFMLQYLVTMGSESFYQQIRFADPVLLEIFDMEYIYGDSSALSDPTGVMISETAAIKYRC